MGRLSIEDSTGQDQENVVGALMMQATAATYMQRLGLGYTELPGIAISTARQSESSPLHRIVMARSSSSHEVSHLTSTDAGAFRTPDGSCHRRHSTVDWTAGDEPEAAWMPLARHKLLGVFSQLQPKYGRIEDLELSRHGHLSTEEEALDPIVALP